MSYTRLKSVDFGPAKSGLTTVRYTLDDGDTWTASGVVESAAQPGLYSATVTFPNGFTGLLTWDTGEVSGSVQASEEINPGVDENSGLIAAGEIGLSCKAIIQDGSTASLLILTASPGFTLSTVVDDYEERLVKILESTAAGRVGCDATAGGWNTSTTALTLSRPFKAAPLVGDVVGLF